MHGVMWIVAGCVGLLLGLALGWLLWRRSAEPEPDPDDRTIPDGLAEIFHVLRSSAVVVAPDGEVLQATSQARALGLVRGMRVVVPILLDLVEQVRADGMVRSTDLELRRGRGATSLFLSARVGRLGDLVLILAEDRTAARRVEQTRRDFVANVSHELKTPIGALALLSEAVESAADDPEAVRNFAGRMGREATRLTELVREIIELSRLQSDDPLMAAGEVAVDTVLAEALERCRERATAREVVLTTAGEKDLHVIGDADYLTTAVANLVENAVIYSEARQKVVVGARLTAEGDDNYVEITVSDTGIGISSAELPRIFERFYRVDYGRSRQDGGTGLGLSIVKHIVAAHGGAVSVWSQPGQGSTFTIRLPEHTHPADDAGPTNDTDETHDTDEKNDMDEAGETDHAHGAVPGTPRLGANRSPINTEEVRA